MGAQSANSEDMSQVRFTVLERSKGHQADSLRREHVDEEDAKNQRKQESSLEGNQANVGRTPKLYVAGCPRWIMEAAVEDLAQVPTESRSAVNTRS